MVAGERFGVLLQREGDSFRQMGFDDIERWLACFKGRFISCLPQNVDNCDEDGCHILGACRIIILGEGQPNCRGRKQSRDLKPSSLKIPEPDGFVLNTGEEKVTN